MTNFLESVRNELNEFIKELGAELESLHVELELFSGRTGGSADTR